MLLLGKSTRKASPMKCIFVVLGACLFLACSGNPLPEVVDVRSVSAGGGQPEIQCVVDLGAVYVPSLGRITAAASDGRAVIGETLMLEGRGFGKQPTVTIGGKPVRVLAHLRGGGIVARVPAGLDPGQVEIEVATEAGRHSVRYPVHRMGLAALGDALQPFEVKADGTLGLGPSLALPVHRIALSHDGSVAYVGGGAGEAKMWIVDLTGSTPKLAGEKQLPGTRLLDLAFAEQESSGVAVTDTHVVRFDHIGEPLPAFRSTHLLPGGILAKKVLRAALDGRGHTLALLLADLNQVAVFNMEAPNGLSEPVLVDVLPGRRLSLVQDLHFSSDGGTLWVVSGDTPRSIAGGHQPAQITLIRLPSPGGAREVSVYKTWELVPRPGDIESAANADPSPPPASRLAGGAPQRSRKDHDTPVEALEGRWAPMALAVATSEPIPPGTIIRPEPSTSALYVAGVKSHLLVEGTSSAESLAGVVARTGLAQKSETVFGGSWAMTSLDVAGKTQVLVVLAWARHGTGWQRALLSRKAWEKGRPYAVSMGRIEAHGQLSLGEVRVQP
jgi:hypothetical protein